MVEEEKAALSWAHFICMATILIIVLVEGAGGGCSIVPGLGGS